MHFALGIPFYIIRRNFLALRSAEEFALRKSRENRFAEEIGQVCSTKSNSIRRGR